MNGADGSGAELVRALAPYQKTGPRGETHDWVGICLLGASLEWFCLVRLFIGVRAQQPLARSV